MDKIDRFINYAEVSRVLSGSRSVITSKFVPEKHRKTVSELRAQIKNWITNNGHKFKDD